MQELIGRLESEADRLKDADYRSSPAASGVPKLLVQALQTVFDAVAENVTQDVISSLAEQAGRAAANFAANNDANRSQLLEADFVPRVLDVLKRSLGHQLQVSALRALAASLLNLVIEGHEPSLKALNETDAVLILLKTAKAVMAKSQDGAEEEIQEATAQWLWTVASKVADLDPSVELQDVIVEPLERSSHGDVPLTIITSACDMLEHMIVARADIERQASASIESAPAPSLPRTPSTQHFHTILPHLCDFVDQAKPSADLDEEEEKEFGMAKAKIVVCLVELCSESDNLGSDSSHFWDRMRDWLSRQEREDLQSCALLCFGNRAREDSSARELLAELQGTIAPLLLSSSTVQIQHALIGLLKNLSIPSVNKTVLGELDLPDKFVQMECWSDKRDMVGSVQGGAIGVVKNLCRGNESNAYQWLENAAAVNQILALMKRTDDQAIRSEGTRVFVNALRSVSGGDDVRRSGALEKLSEEPIVTAFIDMLAKGEEYPVLANEAIVSLALLATFGPTQAAVTIRRNFSPVLPIVTKLADPSYASKSREVHLNTMTLLERLVADVPESKAGKPQQVDSAPAERALLLLSLGGETQDHAEASAS